MTESQAELPLVLILTLILATPAASALAHVAYSQTKPQEESY